jgi:hypothetical protein
MSILGTILPSLFGKPEPEKPKPPDNLVSMGFRNHRHVCPFCNHSWFCNVRRTCAFEGQTGTVYHACTQCRPKSGA